MIIMPIHADKKQIYSLKQLTESLRNAIERITQQRAFWIKAEIAQVNIARSGHAYLEMVELQHNEKVASLAAVIWARDLDVLKTDLGSDFSNLVQQGSEIVFRAKVEFHPVYGLKLQIVEIDLSYALGALEKRKSETIARLKKDNLLTKNRAIPLPKVIQRIALIGAPGSSAYEDFTKHIIDNEHGYRFQVSLFASPVQGDNAAAKLRSALLSISTNDFDAVVFIRGGGSALDLEAFNDYQLCEAAANFHLPILTGIGHETDLSVLDMVAGSPHKTPTAIADFIIDRALSFETQMARMLVHIARNTTSLLKRDELNIKQFQAVLQKYPISLCREHRGLLHDFTTRMLRKTSETIQDNKEKLWRIQSDTTKLAIEKVSVKEPHLLNGIQERLFTLFNHRLTLQQQRIQQLSASIELLHPKKTLARGFSISRVNGKNLTQVSGLEKGQTLETELHGGTILSIIQSIKS
jgi:exodeoxyribonuclease VII large subunit